MAAPKDDDVTPPTPLRASLAARPTPSMMQNPYEMLRVQLGELCTTVAKLEGKADKALSHATQGAIVAIDTHDLLGRIETVVLQTQGELRRLEEKVDARFAELTAKVDELTAHVTAPLPPKKGI